MEDTINKFEETFGMGQSHDGHVIQKRGANNPGSPSGNGSLSTAQQMPSHDVSDEIQYFSYIQY